MNVLPPSVFSRTLGRLAPGVDGQFPPVVKWIRLLQGPVPVILRSKLNLKFGPQVSHVLTRLFLVKVDGPSKTENPKNNNY